MSQAIYDGEVSEEEGLRVLRKLDFFYPYEHALFSMDLFLQKPLKQGLFVPVAFIIAESHCDTNILVQRYAASHLGVIESATHATDDNHRKLQPFTFMNRHNAHQIVVFSHQLYLPHGDFSLLHRSIYRTKL